MTASTINDTTFTLRKKGSTGFTAARVSYDSSTDTAILDPNSLKRGATYTAGVNIGTEDLAGNPLDHNSFTSGSQLQRWYIKVRN
jgi:hypothetical protein